MGALPIAAAPRLAQGFDGQQPSFLSQGIPHPSHRLQQARLAFWMALHPGGAPGEAIEPARIGFVVARSECDYASPARLGERLLVGCRAGDFGTASFVFDYRIVAAGVWLDSGRVRGWHPVVELRGSLSRLLGRIEAVGTDLAWFQAERGAVGAPSLLIGSQPVMG